MSTFGELLREKRHGAGLSQRKLANDAGVDFSYVSKLENGRIPPPAANTIARFAEIIGCPTEDLLAAASKMPSELNASLSSDPAALRFLQEAAELRLSADEWKQMIGTLHGLRSGDSTESLQ